MTEIPQQQQQQHHAVRNSDSDNGEEEEEEEEEDVSVCLTPPPAPVKPPNRGRLWWRGRLVASRSLPKKSRIEDFYRVDTVNAVPLTSGRTFRNKNKNNNAHHHLPPKQVKVLLPGVPRYEDDWARDSHDFFNLIVLVPVTVLNVMNWNWDKLLWASNNHHHNNNNKLSNSFSHKLQAAWTGDWFEVFLGLTVAYFLLDLLWIQLLPHCVKSPGIIRSHHVAVLLFLWLPYQHPPVRYCMGACMAVELNTWFLIARRVFNKQGFPPWTVLEVSSFWSLRIKVISVAFYVTWIGIRCCLYPALLWPFYRHWRDLTRQTGTPWNILWPSVPLHAAFCLLNLKWTYELILSKVRYHRRQRRLRVRSPYNNVGSNSQNSDDNDYLQYPVDKGL